MNITFKNSYILGIKIKNKKSANPIRSIQAAIEIIKIVLWFFIIPVVINKTAIIIKINKNIIKLIFSPPHINTLINKISINIWY